MEGRGEVMNPVASGYGAPDGVEEVRTTAKMEELEGEGHEDDLGHGHDEG
jgi:hypothetical protein